MVIGRVVNILSCSVCITLIVEIGHYRQCGQKPWPLMSFVINTINLLWRNCPEFGTKFQRKVPLFLKIPEFPCNTVYNRWKEVFVPKTSSIRPVVFIQQRPMVETKGVHQFFCIALCLAYYYNQKRFFDSCFPKPLTGFKDFPSPSSHFRAWEDG